MSDTPGWFTRAIDTTPESHRIDVGGTSIHYLAWGERDLPGIVLVHGGAAQHKLLLASQRIHGPTRADRTPR